MIIDAVFKEEEAMKADFGVVNVVRGGGKCECDYSILANALKGSANGNPIVLTDVSPLEHELKVNLSCKNLFYFAETLSDSGEADKESYPEDYDGPTAWSYEAKKGTSEIIIDDMVGEFSTNIDLYVNLSYLLNQLDPNKQYTISVGTKTDMFGYIDFNGSDIWIEGESTPLTFYPKGITEPILHIYDGGSVGTFGIQIEEGTTATAYTPYVENLNGATVKKYAENLLPQEEKTATIGTCSASVNNGVIKYRLGGTKASIAWLDGTSFKLEAGTYTISVIYLGGTSTRTASSLLCGLYGSDNWGGREFSVCLGGKYPNYHKTQRKTFTLTGTRTLRLRCSVEAANGDVCDCDYLFLVEKAETATEPITYTADENGNVSGIIGNGEGMTLIADEGISISAEYSKDLNKVVNDIYQKLSALGVAVVNN